MNRHPNRFVIKIKLDFVLSLLKYDFLMWVFFGTIKTISYFSFNIDAHNMNKTTMDTYKFF